MARILYIDCTRGLASDMMVASLADRFKDREGVLRELQDNINNNMTLTLDSAKSYEREGLIFKAKDNSYGVHSSREQNRRHNCGSDGGHSCEHDHGDCCGDGGEHHYGDSCGDDGGHNNGHSSECDSGYHCGQHEHSTLDDVYEFIKNTAFSDTVKNSAKGVYRLIAEAEAEVHGGSADTVHFHEVGQKRAIACIVCACALIEASGAERIVFSPINTGYGKVVCAHGEVDVPAPATKILLRGIPSFCESGLAGELCTPTGVALAKYFATDFVCDKVGFETLISEKDNISGIGLGSRDIGRANGVISLLTDGFPE